VSSLFTRQDLKRAAMSVLYEQSKLWRETFELSDGHDAIDDPEERERQEPYILVTLSRQHKIKGRCFC